MLNLHRVLFCTGIDLDEIMQIDCLAYKYFVFYGFSLVGYIIWYCVVCDYRGTPPPKKKKKKKSAQFTSTEIRISKIDNYKNNLRVQAYVCGTHITIYIT